MRNPGNTEDMVDDDGGEQSSDHTVPQNELDRWADDGGRSLDLNQNGGKQYESIS
jgi:hypothetical protein